MPIKPASTYFWGEQGFKQSVGRDSEMESLLHSRFICLIS